MTLGIDFGKKKVGTAIAVLGKTLPVPYRLVRYKTEETLLKQLKEIIRREEATTLVFGLPLARDGSENAWSSRVRAFGETLSNETGLPAHFVDERHTSQEADDALVGRSIRAKHEQRDLIAAVIILRRYFASLS